MKAEEYLQKVVNRTGIAKDVPGLGDVKVRGLVACEWDAYQLSGMKSAKGAEYMPETGTLLRYGMIDDTGADVFKDEHIPALSRWPSEVTRPITQEILKLCGVGVDVGKS